MASTDSATITVGQRGTAATDPLLAPNNAPNSSNGRNTAAAHVVNMPSEPSDDETCKLPNWKHCCELVYKGMAGKLCPRLCIPMRKRCRSCYCSCCRSYYRREPDQEEIRRRLKLHFMNPVEHLKCTCKPKGRWPHFFFFLLKLLLQLLIITLVSVQIDRFGEKRTAIPRFIVHNKETIKTLFLDFGSEDSMKVHSMDGLYRQIQKIADTYYNIQSVAVAPYDYYVDDHVDPNDPPLLYATVIQFDTWRFDTATHFIDLSSGNCTDPLPLCDGKNESCCHSDNCTVQSQLAPCVNASSIGSIKSLSIYFKLTSFFIDYEEAQYISCVNFDIDITFNNAKMSGTIPVEVMVVEDIWDCNSKQKDEEFYETVLVKYTILDGLVITTAAVYLVLCILSIIGNCMLTCDTYDFFNRHHNVQLTLGHVMSMQNLWFNGIIIGNNVLVIVGTLFKIIVTYKLKFDQDFEFWTTVILGLGVFSQWCGLLLYLNLFESFNMILLTLRLSLPSAIKFIVCAGVLYAAFMWLGWIVLGPYHPKFANIPITSESLFSLLNGDDIYSTYKEIQNDFAPAQFFTEIYLYIFIALFIYAVVNVFIGLIFDTYQKLQEHRQTPSKSPLQEFAFGGSADGVKRITEVEMDDDSFAVYIEMEEEVREGGSEYAGVVSNRASVNQSPGDSQPDAAALSDP